jgi:hypothetical protein
VTQTAVVALVQQPRIIVVKPALVLEEFPRTPSPVEKRSCVLSACVCVDRQMRLPRVTHNGVEVVHKRTRLTLRR